MLESAPFASSPDGALLVCGDGPELLVYQGSGHPAWKAFCEGILVAVGVGADAVVTADADGRIAWFRAIDGRKREELRVGGGVVALAVAGDGRAVVAGADGIVIAAAGGEPVLWPLPGASAVGIRPDGGAIAAGTQAGTVRVFDGASGAAVGALELGAPISGIVWSARGVWLVAAGASLFVVSADGARWVGRVDNEGPLVSLTVSADGILAAAVIEPTTVAVFELHHTRRAGQVTFRRRVGGVCFGAGVVLGIGLDDGDAQTLDLVGGGAIRTEPHAGRGRNNWNYDARVDMPAIRGALAMSRAGGRAIAAYTGWKPEDEESGWLATCLGCGGGCAFLVFALTAILVFGFVLHSMGYRLL